MFKFEKLIFGDLGWGDEFLIATLMTIMVSICSMGLGIFIAIFAATGIRVRKLPLKPEDLRS